MPLQEFEQIRLRDDIQGTLGDVQAIDNDRKRTPGKDEAAQYIQENVVETGRWPVQMTKLEDEMDWSRQHIANVVEDYFEGVDESSPEPGDPALNTNPMSAGPTQSSSTPQRSSTDPSETKSVFIRVDGQIKEVEISIPPDADSRESYIRGFLDAVERSA